jgi:hypothetical protein
MESSVLPPSPPNTYSYVLEENLGSTRKFVEIYYLFLCTYYQPKFVHYTSRVWAGGAILHKTVGRKFLQPTRSGGLLILTCKECSG